MRATEAQTTLAAGLERSPIKRTNNRDDVES